MEGVRPAYPKIFVPPCYIQQPNILSHWRYEARREAQQLLPHLWIGPIGALKDEQFLNKNNIKVLISLTEMKSKLSKSPDYRYFPFQVEKVHEGGTPLVNFFKDINMIIDEAGRSSVSAIVFCDSGNDYSATVAAAYIMHHLGEGYINAIQFVQGKRFSISLDDALKFDLQTYQGILEAERLQPTQEPPRQGTDKRQIDDVDNDDGSVPENQGAPKRVHEDNDDNEMDTMDTAL